MTNDLRDDIVLRPVEDADLAVFFEQQMEPEASHMAAFTRKDHGDREAFMAHWRKSRADDTIVIRTILYAGQIAGSVASYIDQQFGVPEVTYWIGQDFWGKGIATEALLQFLLIQTTRPIYGRAAEDNLASLRVLEKCRFVVTGQESGFANARGKEIEEVVLKLAE